MTPLEEMFRRRTGAGIDTAPPVLFVTGTISGRPARNEPASPVFRLARNFVTGITH
ncbi:hypothetical protein [Rhizosaccharibacter radicis]|uniref:Uncharacterized protein n=1 Tax=Rhizosaccharibacter radicis TaxID=2782605 RepID=A0ABT1VZ34_9PROT|nr:hypothetical protein [Acetobacteraceae bacterium KSS12]